MRISRISGAMDCYFISARGGLFWWFAVWNGRATGKRVIAKGRLPVPGNYELSAVQELGSIQSSPGKIGAIEHRFKEVRTVQMRTRQIRPAQVRAPEMGTSKVGPRQIE